MKVSILTVSYNSQKTIEDTIKSVLQQDYPNIEYIIVDGNSSDSTMDTIAKHSSGISKVISEPDKGIYDAMNKGVNLATGDLIGILNSDDFYASDNVISQVVELISKEGTDSLYADLVYVDAENTEKVTRKWVSGKYKHGKFKWGWMPPHPTFFVKKSVYEKFGTFNTELKSAADYEFMLRVLHKEKTSVSYLPKLTVRMRAGGVSNASFKHRIRANKEDRKAWELNGIQPYFFTLFLKPIRKIFQFLGN